MMAEIDNKFKGVTVVMVQFAGVKFDFGGMELIIPPLGGRHIVEFKNVIFGESSTDVIEVMKERIPIILLAIQRNHPAFTLEQAWEFVNLRNVRKVWFAATGLTDDPETRGEQEPATVHQVATA